MENDSIAGRMQGLEIDLEDVPSLASEAAASIATQVTALDLDDAKAGIDGVETFKAELECRKAAEAEARAVIAAEKAKHDREEALMRREADSHGSTEYLAVEKASETTGSITYTAPCETTFQALTNAWLAQGLSEAELPSMTSPSVALNRAAKSLQDKSILVRKHPKGWAIVRESLVNEVLVYTTEMVVRLGTDNVPNATLEIADAESESHYALLVAEFNRALATLTSVDMSNWVTRRIKALDAVALRPMGGVYFVPPHKTEKLGKMAQAMDSVGYKVYEIPAVRSESAVKAILDAMTDEAGGVLGEIDNEIQNGVSPTVARNRNDELLSLRSKLERYAALLGPGTFTHILTQLSSLQKQLGEACVSRTARLEVE